MQESQNGRTEEEQGIQILFRINFNTLKAGCPNRACHCWHVLFCWAILILGDNPWLNGSYLLQFPKEKSLHLFKENELAAKDLGCLGLTEWSGVLIAWPKLEPANRDHSQDVLEATPTLNSCA